jgi:nicotinate-nucleotide adenylyltransferase
VAERTVIGLFGGTFDPIHYGHLRLAEELRAALTLARVYLVPAGRPWQRGAPDMVRLAVRGNAGFEADGREIARSGPSYTVDTVAEMRAELAGTSVCVLLGADAFLNLETWHRWRDLLASAHLAVAHRPGHALDPAAMPPGLRAEYLGRVTRDPDALRAAQGGTIYPWEMTPLDISASAIRELCKGPGTARYLLPDAVLDYIESKGLYRSGGE